MPPAVMKMMSEYREASKAAGKFYKEEIPDHDPHQELAKLRPNQNATKRLTISRQEAEQGEPKFDAAGFAARVKAKGIDQYVKELGQQERLRSTEQQAHATSNDPEKPKQRAKLTLKSLRG